MTYSSVKILDKELVASNNICFTSDTIVKIFPIPEKEDFWINFKHTMDDNKSLSTEIHRGDTSISIEHIQTWKNARSSINIDIEIGTDGIYQYFFSYKTEVTGSISRYAVSLSYSVMRESIL